MNNLNNYLDEDIVKERIEILRLKAKRGYTPLLKQEEIEKKEIRKMKYEKEKSKKYNK
jgi:hypothetical protein